MAEITRRLVDYYHPDRIYLFGSAAHGDGGPDRDLDFCVVLPDDAPRNLYLPGVHRALWDVGTAADVVRWPASDERRRDESACRFAQARKEVNAARLLAAPEPSRSVFHS